jgi:phosphonate transport system ATP-binding protein
LIYRLKEVTKAFGSGEQRPVALRDLTLDIGEGERIALIGPSGSGKTTLFRLLNGSIFPTSGRILYHGNDLALMHDGGLREVRRKIGSVYQQHCLVSSMSVLRNTVSGALGRWSLASTVRNLVSPRRDEVERAEYCLDAVGLKDKRHCLCNELSGGQQQRLAIARTLMQEPDVILADEPVASLDPVLADEILSLLTGIAGQRRLTLVVSLHHVDFARRHADRIIGMRHGEVAMDVPPEELDADRLADLYRSLKSRNGQASGSLADDAGEGVHGSNSDSKRPRIC